MNFLGSLLLSPKTRAVAHRIPYLRGLAQKADHVQQMYQLGMQSAQSDNSRFLTFAPPGHFYSPIPDYQTVMQQAVGDFPQTLPEILGIATNDALQQQLLAAFGAYHDDLPFTADEQDGYRYYCDNNYFRYGDSTVLYAMLRHFQPKQVVEVGSGFSSAVMLDTRDHFLEYQPHITFIEPHPERLKQLLSDQDYQSCQIHIQFVQAVDPAIFTALGEGDFLFIDSSHVLKVGSDVHYLLFNILPRLQPGVIVHIHDICWPFEYPLVWYEEGRAWNEAYAVRAFLQFNETFEMLFWNGYLAATQHDALATHLPTFLKDPGSSLWLRKVK